ncbi:uncharacterized protein BDV17DRAFT_291427 [Aspergillus undulatus]|uniref:uncharacterized protein n=1 Tax=Aspergillus undulatus TaxID=1810928 RepID=UPI003CCDC3EA
MSSRNVSTRDDDPRALFEYTSGRYNENIRLSERYGKFNIDALRSAAAGAIQKSSADVKALLKLAEDGFNRVLQITLHDGTELLARLPYPSAVT